MTHTLSGRVALVTGARRGIGAAIARRLAAAGAAVVLGGRTEAAEGLSDVRDAITAGGGRAALLGFDMTDAAARDDAVARAGAAFGPVDILVNNASTNSYEPPSTMPYAAARAIFDLNVHGPTDLIQQALPHMRAQRWGRIVNLSSASRRAGGRPHRPTQDAVVVYGAAKVALERLTTGLAMELHGSGVTVNAYYPTAVALTGANSPTALAGLRRDPKQAEAVEMMAEAALLLVGSGITGTTLSSRDILFHLQAPLHALDGRTVIGDANSLPDLDGARA